MTERVVYFCLQNFTLIGASLYPW